MSSATGTKPSLLHYTPHLSYQEKCHNICKYPVLKTQTPLSDELPCVQNEEKTFYNAIKQDEDSHPGSVQTPNHEIQQVVVHWFLNSNIRPWKDTNPVLSYAMLL